MGKKRYFWIIELVLIILVILIVFGKMVCVEKVIGDSMVPTIHEQDIILTNRLAYKKRNVSMGDIVVFTYRDYNYVKRVLGMPGDEIEFQDGYVLVNGKILEEHYLDPTIRTYSNDKFTVPDGMYFVLGDNREESIDSRYFPDIYIARKDIIGKVIYDFSPLPGKAIPDVKIKAKKS